MREIITDWTLASGGGHVTVQYFDPTILLDVQRAAIDQMYTALADQFATTTGWSVRTEGRVVDPITGETTGFWADGTVLDGSGIGPLQPWADANNALVQWRTDTVVRGRRLQGRTFLPGFGSGAVSGGNLLPALQSLIITAADTMREDAGLLVWSRPVDGAGGQATLASSCSVWSEIAIQRGRRN